MTAFEPAYEYLRKGANLKAQADLCTKFKRKDVLLELSKKAETEADKQIIREAVAKC